MRRFPQLVIALAVLCGLCLSLPAPARGQMVILAFGDSLTRGFGDGNVSCQSGPAGGYPPRLSDRLEDRGLANDMRSFGVCGELTSQGLSRLDEVLSSHADADLVLLMEGTNDLSNLNISTESIRFNLERMTEKAIAALVRPVLASPIPRAPEAGSNGRTGFLASLLREDASKADLDYANQYAELIGVPNLYENYYADPFHTNGQGYGLVAGNFLEPTLSAADRLLNVEPCDPGDEKLCLNQERFQVEVSWEDFEGNTGRGQAVPLTADTGYFWFFDEANVELIVKVLDGRDFNDNYWVFYGALSTVKYTITVTDTERGLRKTYVNAFDNLASVGDTAAFPGEPEGEEDPDSASPAGLSAATSTRAMTAAEGTCTPDVESLCLNGSRFRVRSRWEDFAGKTGTGKAVELSGETGYFWFFDESNVEVVVKALDGREFNGNYWVFYGALSNVEFEIEVTDTVTGKQVVYTNPSGNFGSRADTEAFPEPEP